MSRLLKLAPSQTPLRQVMQPAHNADFCRLSISKHPANAHNINNFSPLAVQDDYTGGALAWEANRLLYSTCLSSNSITQMKKTQYSTIYLKYPDSFSGRSFYHVVRRPVQS